MGIDLSRGGQRYYRTSGVFFAATDRPALDPLPRSHVLPRHSRALHIMGGYPGSRPLRCAGSATLLQLNSSGARESYDQLTAEAAKIHAVPTGLLWTPYLLASATPHLDSNARGALVGLTARTHRARRRRAILEGVAFSLRDTFTLFRE